MMTRAFIISTTLILGGCLSNHVLTSNSAAIQNVERLNQLQIGMTKDEVYQIMRYPATEDEIVTDDGSYDVWFYITKASILDQSQLVARNLTPLIFKDGVFIAIGRNYYNQLLQKSKQPVLSNEPPSAPEPMKENRENVPLEKILTPSPNNQPKSIPASSLENAPVQPNKKVSMCSRPKRIEPSTQDSNEPANDDSNSKEDTSKPKLDEEDWKMLDEEREENFNDW